MISVVVCTYNRAATLQRMLSSFFQQECLEGSNFELLVIDNNSSDATASVAKSFVTDSRCKYIFEPRQGLSAARNRGIAESNGDIVAFLDDDVIVGSLWLHKLAECFEATAADAVGGRTVLLIEGDKPEWLGPFFRNLLSEVDFGSQRLLFRSGEGLWGVNLAFRKATLQEIGAFDENLGRNGSKLLGGEETAMLEKIAQRGGIIVYEPLAFVEHIIGPERLDWKYFSALAHSGGWTRKQRDTQCTSIRQLFRVGKSSLEVLSSNFRFFALWLARSSHYRLKLAAWWRDFHITYLSLRVHEFLAREGKL